MRLMRFIGLGLGLLCIVVLAVFRFAAFNNNYSKESLSLYFNPLSKVRMETALSEMVNPDFTIKGDVEDVEEISRIVLERNPRQKLARLILSIRHIDRSEIEDFNRVFFPLFKIDPENSKVYATWLAALSSNALVYETTRNIIETEKPVWGRNYLDALLAGSIVSPEIFAELYVYYPDRQPSLLTVMQRRQGSDEAYAVFNELVSESGLSGRDIQNPSFKPPFLPAPFGWRLVSSTASIEPGGGIYLTYTGRKKETVLQKMMKVKPGPYDISMIMGGQVSRTNGYFSLSIQCENGLNIESFPIEKLSTTPENYDFQFQVPIENCDFIYVILSGQPGEFPTPVRARLLNLKVTDLSKDTAL